MKPEDLATYAKDKGFIYPSSLIYGGVSGFYDYGHLGSTLKRNVEDAWRSFFLSLNDNFHEIEASSVMPKEVFEGSGHLKNFNDPMVKCTKCGFFARADHFVEEHTKERAEGLKEADYDALIKKHKLACPNCKSALKPVEVMNLMFPVDAGGKEAFLRPETAQSPFVNFKTQFKLLREKLPLGLAVVGKAYRNEISPRNLTLRMREFSQAELQIFFNPENMDAWEGFDAKETVNVVRADKRKEGIQKTKVKDLQLPQMYAYFLARIQEFYIDILGMPEENFRLYELNEEEKAFYNKFHFDIEIQLDGHGWTEVAGLHYRTDHDLKGHQSVSKEKMEVNDEGKKFIPHVLEVSFGIDRNVYALLDQHLENDEKRGNLVLHLPRNLAPVPFTVFPLVNKVHDKARALYEALRVNNPCTYDKSGSVGRRYARADEMGTPLCITVDFEEGVTLRERDSAQQVRVTEDALGEALQAFFLGESLENIGEPITK